MAEIDPKEVKLIAFQPDPNGLVDWTQFDIENDQVIDKIVNNVIEQFDVGTPTLEQRYILISTLAKTLTENVVMKAKIQQLIDQANKEQHNEMPTG
ncbi:hypothetical protein N9A25_00250 [bacterium]|nr:hypothetical protein [bacterium]